MSDPTNVFLAHHDPTGFHFMGTPLNQIRDVDTLQRIAAYAIRRTHESHERFGQLADLYRNSRSRRLPPP